MKKIYYRNLHSNKLERLQEFKIGSWIALTDPTEEQIEELVKEFKLDDGVMADSLDKFEVPRYERVDDIVYIFTRYPVQDKSIATAPITMVLGENFIITVTLSQTDCISKLLDDESIITTQKTKLFIQILNSIVSSYEKNINRINKQINTYRSKIETISNNEIIRLVEFEKSLNEFNAALLPTSLFFTRLLNGKSIALYKEDDELIEDISLSISQLIENSNSIIKHIVNIREAYSTILSNNLNKTMKFLTGITVVLTIPTIITSFFGMNVSLPLDEHPLAFIMVILITISFSSVITAILIKKGMM